ncbi:MAG: hypothetical protein GKR90_08465 [Pseudomonadales bacterium]|nr:hypothetical protein [Pseudomonadales bacterium]
MKFDPQTSWLPLRDKAATTENQLHRTLLEQVANHMEAEINGRLEPLMATLTAHPKYHFWHVGPENMILDGYEAVSGFYQNMFANEGQNFHVICERIMVDDTGVVTEGQVRQQYKSDALLAMGVTTANGQKIASSPRWLSNTQLITVWPNAGDGKLIGEDIYFGEDPMTTLMPFTEDA